MFQREGNKHFGAQIMDQVLKLREEGVTHHEIAERFGLKNATVSKELVKRYHRNRRKIAQGILPRRKGRPSKHEKVETLEKKVLRLERENDLLRSFLQRLGRS